MALASPWMTPAEWRAQADAAPAAGTAAQARPVTYQGVRFRSTLEAGWACTLDSLGIEWEYEPSACQLATGETYLPDLWLPALRTVIEVKGSHMQRAAKPRQLAAEQADSGVIVLFGFAPGRTSQSPYSWESKLKWQDALGYDTRLALCERCARWQWVRAQLGRGCRACPATLTGLLARCGEIAFQRWAVWFRVGDTFLGHPKAVGLSTTPWPPGRALATGARGSSPMARSNRRSCASCG